jgi:hypothetical protein
MVICNDIEIGIISLALKLTFRTNADLNLLSKLKKMVVIFCQSKKEG